MLSFGILFVTAAAAGGVLAYKLYLEGIAKQKANQIAIAEQRVDQATVAEFIRLRDRFSSAKTIINQHVGLSQFFDTLETLTLQGVKYSRLQIYVKDDRRADVVLTGTARTFNTLAAQSASFATDKRIKRAIFSGIGNDETANNIRFEMRAELDPALVIVNTPSQTATTDTVPTTSAPVPQATTTTP